MHCAACCAAAGMHHQQVLLHCCFKNLTGRSRIQRRSQWRLQQVGLMGRAQHRLHASLLLAVLSVQASGASAGLSCPTPKPLVATDQKYSSDSFLCGHCRFLERLRDRRGPNFTYEIIIVDDGSQDNTLE